MGIPFVSQLGNSPRNDCGPACALMLARGVGKGTLDSVASWAQKIDASDDGTTAAELAWMLRGLGLTPVVNQVLEYPYIALVDYAQLPKANRIDQTGRTFAHWVVRLSDTTYHDPYHWSGPQVTTKAILDVAVLVGAQKYWRNVILKLGILEGMMATKMVVDSPDGLNVRAWGGVAPNNKIGWLAQGEEVVITEEASGWKKIALMDTARGSKVNGWVSGQYLKAVDAPVQEPAPSPVPAPNPIPTPGPSQGEGRKPLLGFNVLNRHEEVALPLAKKGCRYFNVLDNVGFASHLKDLYPDAVVSVRRYWNHALPNVDGYLAAMDGCRDKRLIYLGPNEADEAGQDYVGITRRFEWEKGIAQKLHEMGCVYAGGGFSMGTPDFTDREICGLIKSTYAPLYNAGVMSWNHHLYSPNMLFGQAGTVRGMQGIMAGKVGKGGYMATWANMAVRGVSPIAPIWFETRWRFLFSNCGFDVASKSGIYCDETGVDEGGVGGFPAHGATNADVRRWSEFWLGAQAQPVDGKPSPMVGGAVFQVGNREDWRGYNVEAYADALI